MLSTRATLLAKHVTAIRPSSDAIRSRKLSRTSASEPDVPSTIALVLSHTMASTPSSPNRAKAASSVGLPISGSGSSLKSPVCRMVPCGVRITSACASGIECDTGRNCSENGASSKLPPDGIVWIRTSLRMPASPSLRRSTAVANGVA